MPKDPRIKKVLVIGSGPIIIGQAAEFDYSGTQACRALKAEGIETVLLNSNPATIMTDPDVADHVYIEPMTLEVVERILDIEKPDSVLPNLGGQMGLNLSMELARSGYLDRTGIRLLACKPETIDRAEDRELFKETMEKLHQPIIPSEVVETLQDALACADRIGYPVIVRPAFTMGGTGGGICETREKLIEIGTNGLRLSPIHQILVEKCIAGWKEIEYEVMRDHKGNVITVCNMENLDPVGIHTGDSVVVAPSQTLTDHEYQMLRTAALDIITELGIEGGCNCQFALKPDSFDYAVIEVNPRVSRSSALASKATGYPIAKVATKIAIGYTLDEITNDVTGKTCACFEPALDYIVVKYPKWPFDKFVYADKSLGTQMMATGEVMSIGNSFEAAMMKAVSSIELGMDTLTHKPFEELTDDEIVAHMHVQDAERVFCVYEALKRGIDHETIYKITKIDWWFLDKMQHLADLENGLAKCSGVLTEEQYKTAKKYGFQDKTIKRLAQVDKLPVENYRAGFKMVDTCAAEFSANTPYFYSTYDGDNEAAEFIAEKEAAAAAEGKPKKKKVLVFGSGPIRIGQGIEFDYCSVHCVWTLKKHGCEAILVNNNPETVSTDYDTADRLYFEPLTAEDVLQIIDVEQPVGVVVAFGGQTAIALTQTLDRHGIRILGTSAEGIDIAEDRERFDELLERFHISRPKGMGVQTLPEALHAAQTLGYPVLLRPSYVIGGQNMKIVHDDAEVTTYMQRILAQGIDNPVLVDKYMMGTELEVDVISDGTDVLIPGIMEHIERAGVHSGDSIAVYPPYNLNDMMTEKIVDSSRKLALALGTKGLVNIQYLIWENELYVIEVNPRASRTVPYISKVTGVPMVDVASRVMLGAPLKSLGYGTGLHPIPPYYAVKVPVFSFEKLGDVNAYLGPEMKSTGEVLGLGKTMQEALFKGLTSAGMVVGQHPDGRHGVFVSVDTHDLGEIVSLAKKLDDLHFALYATEETAAAIARLGIDVVTVDGIRESDHAFALLESGCIDYIVYTGALKDATMDDYIALHRRALQLGIPCFTSLDTANALADIIASRYNERNTELVDINHMRTERQSLKFAKMQATGDDYIYVENFDGHITCPESLCIPLCSRHRGIGGYGIVLIEHSDAADAKMRVFNRDGSAGGMGGNAIRCVAKYLYDNGIVPRDDLTIEAGGLVHRLHLYTRFGTVGLVTVDMGKPAFEPANVPVTLAGERVIDRPVTIAGGEYRITCLSMGNPHCVVFADRVDEVDVAHLGPQFEHADIFPARTNTEFIRVVNRTTIKMRVWERGNGETRACGTGACAAVVAATENGLCPKGEPITVKVSGGDLIVTYDDDGVRLTGNAELAFTGVTTY